MDIPGFLVDSAILSRGAGSKREVISITLDKYSKLPLWSIYVSGPRIKGRRVNPFSFQTNSLDNLPEQIKVEKAKLL